MEEVFLVAKDRKEADEIFGKNTPEQDKLRKDRMRYLEEKGVVDELSMPGTRQEFKRAIYNRLQNVAVDVDNLSIQIGNIEIVTSEKPWETKVLMSGKLLKGITAISFETTAGGLSSLNLTVIPSLFEENFHEC